MGYFSPDIVKKFTKFRIVKNIPEEYGFRAEVKEYNLLRIPSFFL